MQMIVIYNKQFIHTKKKEKKNQATLNTPCYA